MTVRPGTGIGAGGSSAPPHPVQNRVAAGTACRQCGQVSGTEDLVHQVGDLRQPAARLHRAVQHAQHCLPAALHHRSARLVAAELAVDGVDLVADAGPVVGRAELDDLGGALGEQGAQVRRTRDRADGGAVLVGVADAYRAALERASGDGDRVAGVAGGARRHRSLRGSLGPAPVPGLEVFCWVWPMPTAELVNVPPVTVIELFVTRVLAALSTSLTE